MEQFSPEEFCGYVDTLGNMKINVTRRQAKSKIETMSLWHLWSFHLKSCLPLAFVHVSQQVPFVGYFGLSCVFCHVPPKEF